VFVHVTWERTMSMSNDFMGSLCISCHIASYLHVAVPRIGLHAWSSVATARALGSAAGLVGDT
jgi:hypothetical protein